MFSGSRWDLLEEQYREQAVAVLGWGRGGLPVFIQLPQFWCRRKPERNAMEVLTTLFEDAFVVGRTQNYV